MESMRWLNWWTRYDKNHSIRFDGIGWIYHGLHNSEQNKTGIALCMYVSILSQKKQKKKIDRYGWVLQFLYLCGKLSYFKF